eukprot:7732634-Pyramimonas_sp.AAC.1
MVDRNFLRQTLKCQPPPIPLDGAWRAWRASIPGAATPGETRKLEHVTPRRGAARPDQIIRSAAQARGGQKEETSSRVARGHGDEGRGHEAI